MAGRISRVREHILGVLGLASLGALPACGNVPTVAEVCIQVDAQECPDPSAEDLPRYRENDGDERCSWEVAEVGSLTERISDSTDTASGSIGCCYDVDLKPGSRDCEKIEKHTGDGGNNTIDGRPLVRDGRPQLGTPTWQPSDTPHPAELTALAEHWARIGAMEHASIPAFAEVADHLTRLGAPADLIQRSLQARADEVVHAGLAFHLASRFAGVRVEPGQIRVSPPEPQDLAAFAAATFLEACVGETLAVAMAAERLRQARDPEVRRVLGRVVADETRHAELAWDTVAWAIEVGGDAVRERVCQAFEAVELPDFGPEPAEDLSAFGRVSRADLREAAARCFAEVVIPGAEALLG